MSRRSPRVRAALVLASVLLVAGAACSDDGGADGDGTTTAPSTTAEMTTSTTDASGDEASGQPGALAQTAWVLARIVEPGGANVDASTGPVPAVISFGAQGVDVFDGINTVGGEYTLQDGEVSFELGTPSQFPYPDDLPQYGLIGHLARLERAVVDGSTMQFTLRDGTVLDFEQATNRATG